MKPSHLILLKPKKFGNSYRLKFSVSSFYNFNKPKLPIPADTISAAILDLAIRSNIINGEEIEEFLNSFAISSSLIKYENEIYIPVSPYLITKLDVDDKKMRKYFRNIENFVNYKIYLEENIDKYILERYKLPSKLKTLSYYWKTAIHRITGSALKGRLRKESYFEIIFEKDTDFAFMFMVFLKNNKYLGVLEKVVSLMGENGLGKNKTTDFYGSIELIENSILENYFDFKGKGILLSPILLDKEVSLTNEEYYNIDLRTIFLEKKNENENKISTLSVVAEGSYINLEKEITQLIYLDEKKIRYFSSIIFKEGG